MLMSFRRVMNKIRIAVYLFIAICCIMFGALESKAQDEVSAEEAGGRATVISDSLTVFLRMSPASEIVKKLKKGDVVTVEYEIEGAGGAWCGIKEEGQTMISGYVRCQYLELQVLQKKSWESFDPSVTEESATGKTAPPQPQEKPPKPKASPKSRRDLD
jgi:hypothetical protein